jgi:hypothetical protein
MKNRYNLLLFQSIPENGGGEDPPETESVWRSMMAKGIAFMKARYHPQA